MAGGNRGSTPSQTEGGDTDDKRNAIQRSLPKIKTAFSRAPNFLKRSKTSDGVPKTKHAEPEATQRPVYHQRHDCRAADAACKPGPSKPPPPRPTRSEGGSQSHSSRSAHPSTSTRYSTSTGVASRYGSAAASDRSSSAWTRVTTPDHAMQPNSFVPRPGVIPDTSSTEEDQCSAGRGSTTYSPRTSDSTAAEAVRVRNQEVLPSHSFEIAQSKAQSQPSTTSYRGSFSSNWRSALGAKPDKGKAKARECNEVIDGKMTKKARSKCFVKPAALPLLPIRRSSDEMPPVLTDPGHDEWAELPLLQKKKLSARVNSNLSKYNWSAAIGRKQQPPVVEPIGPAGEDRFGVHQSPIADYEDGSRVHHVNLGVSSSRIVPAGLPAAVPEHGDESDNYPSPTSSAYLLSGGECSSDEVSYTPHRSRKKPRDSTRPRQYRNESVDLEALNSKHVKAAGFEKMCCSKLKSKIKSKNADPCCGDDKGSQQKLEMWRTNSKAGFGEGEAQFVMCESPEDIDREMEREAIKEKTGCL